MLQNNQENNIHVHEKQQFKKLLIQEGIDQKEDRFNIFEAFLANEGHVTAEEFSESIVNSNEYTVNNDLIKDTLDLMVHFGFAEIKKFDDNLIRYEHRHMDDHHDHMICTKCGQITEFTNELLEQLQRQISNIYNFHMLRHKMEIYGICETCLKSQPELISLATAKEGNQLLIKGYVGGRKANMRLINMGIRIGDHIHVLTNSGHGQMVISLGHTRMVLGRGVAQKILVERISF